MSEPSLYDRVLARIERVGNPYPPRPPRSSAAVVPWRVDDGGEVEVYWVERSPELAFMGGWHAFPGGGLDRADAGVPVAGEPEGVAGAPDPALPETLVEQVDLGPLAPPGLTACALRELFEETGLLPLAGGVEAPSAERLGADREDLLTRRRPFAEIVAGWPAPPDAGRLVYAGRWLTPPLGPVRFDNRFFLLDARADDLGSARIVPGEIATGEWIRPTAALDRWRRGEIVTAPPILHLLDVLATEGPEAGLERMRRPVEANLDTFRRIEFRPGVLLFPLRTPTLPPASYTNCYLLGGGEAVLVDPGAVDESELDRLEGALAECDRRLGRRPREIWLTHHHADHVGGVERLRRSLGIPVAAHRLTAERLAGRGVPVDRLIEDGETTVLAGDPELTVRAFLTPGHARGHLAFLDETLGSLLAGDLLAGFGTIVIDPPEGDMSDYLASLERVAALEPAALFPAHGGVLWGGGDRLRQLVEHRSWREERILAAWRDGLREPAAMLATVYDDVPEAAWPLAERQILSHLARLRAQGRLDDPR